MPAAKDKDDKQPDTIQGYSGSPHEGEDAIKRPKEASDDATLSPLGHTEPTKVYKGDGVTPHGEKEKKGK
jgi:hypothetical protein